MKQQKISVVIPLYNKEHYVLNAIQSTLVQDSAVLEVIVVDDGSTDSGPERVEDLNDPRVKLIRKKNGGVSSARNIGIRAAQGDYISFLDADDTYLDGFVAEILQLIERFPNARVYATSYYRRWPDGRNEANYLPRILDATTAQMVQDPFRAWSRASFIHIGSLCVRRDSLCENNIFFPVGENVGEDQDVIFRLMEIGQIAFSPKPLMSYSQQIANSLYSSLPDYVLPCYVRLRQRASTRNYPSNLRPGAYRTVSVGYLNVARILISKRRHLDAARLIFKTRSMLHPAYWCRTLVRLFLPERLMQSQWLKWI